MLKKILERFKGKEKVIDASTNSLNTDNKFNVEIKKIRIKNIQTK